MKGTARAPLKEPRCDAVTPTLRAIENVPTGARWRLSWSVDCSGRARRVVLYVLRDDGAQAWCAAQHIEFPGDAVARTLPAESTASSAIQSDKINRFDIRSRAAGDAQP